MSLRTGLLHLYAGRAGLSAEALQQQMVFWELDPENSNHQNIASEYYDLAKNHSCATTSLMYPYEGGVLLLTLFVVMLYPIYKRFDMKIFFWIFIISSLHTSVAVVAMHRYWVCAYGTVLSVCIKSGRDVCSVFGLCCLWLLLQLLACTCALFAVQFAGLQQTTNLTCPEM